MAQKNPLKSALLFFYIIAALTAVGTSVNHLWKTHAELIQEKKQTIPAKPS